MMIGTQVYIFIGVLPERGNAVNRRYAFELGIYLLDALCVARVVLCIGIGKIELAGRRCNHTPHVHVVANLLLEAVQRLCVGLAVTAAEKGYTPPVTVGELCYDLTVGDFARSNLIYVFRGLGGLRCGLFRRCRRCKQLIKLFLYFFIVRQLISLLKYFYSRFNIGKSNIRLRFSEISGGVFRIDREYLVKLDDSLLVLHFGKVALCNGKCRRNVYAV